MARLRTGLAVTLAVVGAAAAAPTAVPASAAQANDAAAHVAACKYVKIAGKRTCLASGRHCSPKHQSAYVKNGFSCATIGKGRHRLVRNKQSF